MRNYILLSLLGILLYYHLFNAVVYEGVQKTEAVGILSRINSHLSSLTPEFSKGPEDIPVQLKVDIDQTKILDGIKEGFLDTNKSLNNNIHEAYEIPNFYREGLSPAVVHLENINSRLNLANFPKSDETNTEVEISLEENTKEGRDRLRKNILKKFMKKIDEEKKKRKIVEEFISDYPPKDFSKMYDETYDFNSGDVVPRTPSGGFGPPS